MHICSISSLTSGKSHFSWGSELEPSGLNNLEIFIKKNIADYRYSIGLIEKWTGDGKA